MHDFLHSSAISLVHAALSLQEEVEGTEQPPRPPYNYARTLLEALPLGMAYVAPPWPSRQRFQIPSRRLSLAFDLIYASKRS